MPLKALISACSAGRTQRNQNQNPQAQRRINEQPAAASSAKAANQSTQQSIDHRTRSTYARIGNARNGARRCNEQSTRNRINAVTVISNQ